MSKEGICKKLNQKLILSKTLPIIIKTDSSKDLDSQTMESLPPGNVSQFRSLAIICKSFYSSFEAVQEILRSISLEPLKMYRVLRGSKLKKVSVVQGFAEKLRSLHYPFGIEKSRSGRSFFFPEWRQK